MKLKLSSLAISLVISFSAFATDLTEYRKHYYGVSLNQSSIHDFNTLLELHPNNDNVAIKGYEAIIWFLWADYYVNPIKKWKCFNKGKSKLEKLIHANLDNVELRFLRLTIQDNIPHFLNYHSHRIEDRKFIYSQLDQVSDTDLQARIINYLSHNSMAKMK